MEYVAIGIALAALLFAIAAMSRARSLTEELEEARADVRRLSGNIEEEVEAQLATQRRLLAAVQRGDTLTSEMILEGRLWSDVQSDEATRMLGEDGLHVLDVRTPMETAAGIIPGAQRIPVDELEQRLAEVPKSSRRVLVYCAGGGRSAAACEFLSRQGYDGLMNLAGGFSSWTGPSEKPS